MVTDVATVLDSASATIIRAPGATGLNIVDYLIIAAVGGIVSAFILVKIWKKKQNGNAMLAPSASLPSLSS